MFVSIISLEYAHSFIHKAHMSSDVLDKIGYQCQRDACTRLLIGAIIGQRNIL